MKQNIEQEIYNASLKIDEAYRKKEYRKAIELSEEVLNLYTENKNENSLEYARILSNMGMAFSKIDNYLIAGKCLINSMEIKVEIDRNNISCGNTVANMGVVAYKLGDYEKAIHCINNSLPQLMKYYGDENIAVLHFMFCLGKCYIKINEPMKSLHLLENVVKHIKFQNNISSVELADIYETMSECYYKNAMYGKAIETYGITLYFIRKSRGVLNYNYANYMDKLGDSYDKCGFNKLALECYEKAILIKNDITTDCTINLIESYRKIGEYCLKVGFIKDSIKYYLIASEKAKAITTNKSNIFKNIQKELNLAYSHNGQMMLGIASLEEMVRDILKYLENKEECEDVSIFRFASECMLSLANIYDMKKEYENALEHLDLAIDWLDLSNSVVRIKVYAKLGVVYGHLKAYEGGVVYLLEAIRLSEYIEYEKKLELHCELYFQLSDVYYNMGNIEESCAILKECVELYKKKKERGVFYLRNILEKLSLLYEKIYDYNNAKIEYEKIMILDERMYGNTKSPKKIEILNKLGFLNYKIGFYAESNSILKRNIENICSDTLEEKYNLCEVLISIAVNYLCLGQVEEAKKTRENAIYKYKELKGEELEKSKNEKSKYMAINDSRYIELNNIYDKIIKGEKIEINNKEYKKPKINKNLLVSALKFHKSTDKEYTMMDKEYIDMKGLAINLSMASYYKTKDEKKSNSFILKSLKEVNSREDIPRCKVYTLMTISEYYIKYKDYKKADINIKKAGKELLNIKNRNTVNFYESKINYMKGDIIISQNIEGKEEVVELYFEEWLKYYNFMDLPIYSGFESNLNNVIKYYNSIKKYNNSIEKYRMLIKNNGNNLNNILKDLDYFLKMAEINIITKSTEECDVCLKSALEIAVKIEEKFNLKHNAYDKIGKLAYKINNIKLSLEVLKKAYNNSFEYEKSITKEGINIFLKVLKEVDSLDIYELVENREKLY